MGLRFCTLYMRWLGGGGGGGTCFRYWSLITGRGRGLQNGRGGGGQQVEGGGGVKSLIHFHCA